MMPTGVENNATAHRSYRWLFWTLAVVGLLVDQGTKYGMFAWLYNDPEYKTERIPGKVTTHARDVIPGLFSFDANYTHQRDPDDDWRSPLRTVSSEMLPGVNRGALWGIGGRAETDETGSDFNIVFAIVSALAAAAIVLWSLRWKTANDRILCMALGLILGGTLGNLYDRIVFSGVRDWLHWRYVIVMNDFPVFNIADSCLVCGAGLLLLQAFFADPAAQAAPQTTTATEAPLPETASK
jgi:signal peptidase II